MFYILLTSKACCVLAAIAIISFFFFSSWFNYGFLKNSVVNFVSRTYFSWHYFFNRIAYSSNTARSSGEFYFMNLCCWPLSFYNYYILWWLQNTWTHVIVSIHIQKASQHVSLWATYLNSLTMCSVLDFLGFVQIPKTYGDSKYIHHKSKKFIVCSTVIASNSFLGQVFQSGSLSNKTIA